MSDLSEFTHDYSRFEDDPLYRNLEDEIDDLVDGVNCPEDWHQECDPDYPNDCTCEPD